MQANDGIDRITPALEPDQPVVMRQNWHHLGFLHWEVPVQELQSLVPSRLTIDTFEGKGYVAIVPFTVTGARPVLLPPVPLISNFHEVNVRTYVHLDGRDPGVWFFSLDASSSIAVEAARAMYKLSYYDCAIELGVGEGALPKISFDARRSDPRSTSPAHAHLQYGPSDGVTTRAVPGSLEHFLIERYILYAMDSDHQLHRARVHHAPYEVQKADVLQLDETLIWAAGVRRSDNVPLRHYAREVNVKVYPLEKC